MKCLKLLCNFKGGKLQVRAGKVKQWRGFYVGQMATKSPTRVILWSLMLKIDIKATVDLFGWYHVLIDQWL